VESHNYLGIYLRPERATVVCVAVQGRDKKLLGCFSVSVEGQQENAQQALAERIAQGCSERDMKFGQAAVALDCTLFMQHAVHSEFSDYKKIAATVRFDTEEALAMDVSDVAVAFRIASSDDSGSNLDVFTAQRSVLTEILLALQGAGLTRSWWTLTAIVCPAIWTHTEGLTGRRNAGSCMLCSQIPAVTFSRPPRRPAP